MLSHSCILIYNPTLKIFIFLWFQSQPRVFSLILMVNFDKPHLMDLDKLLHQQKKYFQQNQTKSIELRKVQLEKLKTLLKKHEDKLYQAIYKDLKKSKIETYSTEISLIYKEISYFQKHLKRLSKPKKVSTNIINQISSNKIYSEPYGNTLIISAWNYPYQLSLVPAINALAAGNTVLLKPSELAPHTAKAMKEIINTHFPKELFHVVLGGVTETTKILKEKFDKIFFTGSPRVGKMVYQAAAKHLTPVTLELGGKSPVIVTASANLEIAARRIVWGKFLNAGQTCLAPDYIYVEKSIKKHLLEELKTQIIKAKYKQNGENYTKIINEKHFKRLTNLINTDKVYFGGKSEASKLFIEPTILDNVTWGDAVMKEEIFGPILPVLTFTNYEELLAKLKTHEKPLSAYLFSTANSEKQKFTEQLSFGGGCVNDTVMHVANQNLPFGGVGNSGMGSYHGAYGFNAFSHQKSVLDKALWGEPDLKYPPYTKSKKKWIKRIM